MGRKKIETVEELALHLKEYGIAQNRIVTLDNVCCTALCMFVLKRVYGEDAKIKHFVRIDSSLVDDAIPRKYGEYIICTGGRDFDGTQCCVYRNDGLPYSSFGLMWRVFGEQLLGETFAEEFDQSFVRYVDKSALGLSTPLDMYLESYPGKMMSSVYYASDEYYATVCNAMLDMLTIIFGKYIDRRKAADKK